MGPAGTVNGTIGRFLLPVGGALLRLLGDFIFIYKNPLVLCTLSLCGFDLVFGMTFSPPQTNNIYLGAHFLQNGVL